MFNNNREFFSNFNSINNKSFINRDISIKQIYISHNIKIGNVIGLHFQNPPFMEEKIVRCLKGSVFM